MIDSIDRNLLIELEKGIPLEEHPYAIIGSRLGISEDEVIHRISELKQKHIIRRMRARINQRSIGITANALVVWKIPKEEYDSAGITLSAFPQISHAYRRTPIPGRWEFTHYTVHHGWSREQVLQEVIMIAEKTGYSEYMVLFSTEEFKRTPHTRASDIEDTL